MAGLGGWFGKSFANNSAVSPLPTTDLHSHVLPGIDDGAASVEESLGLVAGMLALGYQTLITTPHVIESYPNTSDTILAANDILQAAIQKGDIPVKVIASAEYYLDHALLESIRQGEKLLTFGRDYFLFETHHVHEPVALVDRVREMIDRGLRPILAHPERYAWGWGKPDLFLQLREAGVLMQVNLGSFTGHYSENVKRMVGWLVQNQAVDLLGSDLHHSRHLGLYESARRLPIVQTLLSSGRLRNHELLA
jgi:protein-tyrosine phosphatase